MYPAEDPRVIREGNLRAFFHQAIQRAARNQRLDAGGATLHYLAHLLTDYASSSRLFDHSAEGVHLSPLAGLYGAALQAGSPGERRLWLQRLGDLALFLSGLFSERLRRGLVDVDYYIAMGGNAYGYLCQTGGNSSRDRALGDVFGELSRDFVAFMDLLGEVGENAAGRRALDPARLYELWRRSGSARLAGKLRELGIEVGRGPPAWLH